MPRALMIHLGRRPYLRRCSRVPIDPSQRTRTAIRATARQRCGQTRRPTPISHGARPAERAYDVGVASENLPAGNDLAQRLAAARRDVEANVLQLDLARSRLQATRQRISANRTQRQVLHDSVFARLTARLESQPVIEQAKGILIAQVGCSPDEAFGLLRAASQRSNVPVRDLARDIVNRTAAADRTADPPKPKLPKI
jgi:hypothetical protein